MDTAGGLIDESPPSHPMQLMPLPASIIMDEALEQFLEVFFAHYMLDANAQQALRDALAKNMIHSVYSLSRATPNALLMAGLPFVFVDECMRLGIFVPEVMDNELALASPMPSTTAYTATRARNTNKWDIENKSYTHASQDTPYRRDTPNTQRTENWSLDEMIILLDAKKIEDNGYPSDGLCKKIRSAKDKWDAISVHCVDNNVQKTAHQCWVKWVKLNKSFRKIFRYEREIFSSEESFWNLSTKARKERSLPTSLNQDIFNAMVERFGTEPGSKYGSLSIELPCVRDEKPNGEPLSSKLEMQDDLISMSSQQVKYRSKRPKLEVKPPSSKKDTVYSTKQLVERFEVMEHKRLEIESERIAGDEKCNIIICNAISEIASAIKSIAEALHNKK